MRDMRDKDKKILDSSTSLENTDVSGFEKKWYLNFDYSKYGVYWTRILSYIIIVNISLLLVSFMTNENVVYGVITSFCISVLIIIIGLIKWLLKD